MNLEAELIQSLLDTMQHPPEQNCSCHISAPCSDCTEYAGLREAIADAESYIKIQEETIA